MILYKLSNYFTVTIILSFFSFNVYSQDTNPVQAWEIYMTPDANHNYIKEYLGKWNVQASMTMEEGQAPQVTPLTAEITEIMDGRFFEIKLEGIMQEFEIKTLMTLGFNTSSGKAELTEITNLGTGMLLMSGEWSRPAELLVLKGEMKNPVADNYIHIEKEFEFLGPNQFVIRNYDSSENADRMLTIEYIFTRSN